MGMTTPAYQPSAPPPPSVESPACTGACGCAPVSLKPPAPTTARATGRETVLHISTMDCPSEEQDIRRALAAVPGLRTLRFELAARTLTIEAPPDTLAAALSAIRRAGFAPRPLEPRGEAEPVQDRAVMDRGIWRAGTALLLAVGAETLHLLAADTPGARGLGMALAAVAISLSGLSTYAKGWTGLRRGQLNMNALMAIAVTGAFLIGEWPEAAMVMALYAVAEWIEARSVDRARRAITGLLALAPDTAEVRQAGGGWVEVPADQVPLDAVVRVRPGGRIPLDGLVTAGASAVDQAPVTGEASRSTRRWTTPCLPGPSTKPACWSCGSPPPPAIRRWRGSFTRSSRRRVRGHRHSASSIGSRQSIRPPCLCLPSPSPSLRPSGWAGAGPRRSTRRWCCWSSPVPAPW